MLNIKNQVFVTIKIDGKAIEYANIKDITLCEGNGVFAPTLKIELDDPSSVLSKTHALSEGNTIEILIARSMDDANAKPRKYRVFGPTRDNPSYNPNVMVIGLLNCPLYFTASARECTTGTSADAIRAIANKVGLTYSGPSKGRSLNDKMIWLDVCTTRAQNVYEITRRGYMDDNSCMESMVTSYHELRYRNIVDEINITPDQIKYLFVHSTLEDPSTGTGKKTYIVKEARDRSSSGVMSTWTNYGSTRCANHISGTQRDRKSVDVKTPGAYLAINKEVTDMVKRTRFDYAPIDCSNTHQQYQNAWYQNIKIMALFTETMSLLTLEVTDIQLFDILIYRQADSDPKSKVRNEDIYMLIGKTMVVRGGVHYAERLQCVRMSLTMKGEAPLETSLGDDYGAPSIVPESSINMSAIGSGLASIGSLTSVVQKLTSINSVNGALSAVTSMLPNVAGPAVQAISSVQSLIKSGNPTQILSGMSSMLAPVQQVVQQATQLQSQVTQLPQLATSMASSIPSQLGVPSQLASAAFTKPGSILSSIAQASAMALLFGNMGNQSKATISSAPGQCRLSDDGQTITNDSDSILSSVFNTSKAIASSWNTMLSSTSGYQVPPQYNQQTPQQQQTTVQNGFLMRLMVQMLMTGTDPVALTRFVTQELSRQPAGSPNWMAHNELVPQTNSSMDMASLTRLISNLG